MTEESSMKKAVSFTNLEIRSYPYILGDHPECKFGAPVTLGWEHFHQNETTIDLYETTKGPKRAYCQLLIPAYDRRQMLLAKGISRQDIREAIVESAKIKHQRKLTIFLLEYQFLDNLIDNINRLKRKLKRKH